MSTELLEDQSPLLITCCLGGGWAAAWGQTALQFNNEVAVAKFYTETLNQSTTDMETLRSVMAQVSHLTDVSTPEVQISLIGQALLAG